MKYTQFLCCFVGGGGISYLVFLIYNYEILFEVSLISLQSSLVYTVWMSHEIEVTGLQHS